MINKNIKSQFKGKVIFPEDDDYDKFRQVFYGGMDRKPAAIILVSGSEDIKHAILLAKQESLDLAVRSGGHSLTGYSSADGAIVIDLRNMKKLDIDVSAKTAWAETGLTAAEVTNELDKHDLVLGFGDTGSVGIGGITLGGGVGFLVRKFGLTIDNVLAAEIITAKGEILQIDNNHHPDLFWGIRGGGGNFGVVTKFKYQLHELSECYGGMLILPATEETITGFMEVASNAPNELSTIANIMPVMPMPMVPEEHHGKLGIMGLILYAGDTKEGEKLVDKIRTLAKPIVDTVKPIRYKDAFFPEQEGYHPTAVSRNMHINQVDANYAKVIMKWLNKIEAPMKVVQLRALGGAMAEIPTNDTAYAHRNNPIMVNIAAFYETNQEKKERQQWVNDFAQELYQDDHSAYVNFISEAEEDRLKDVYPKTTLKRLKQVKNEYDPDNLFKLNFNVQPS